MKNKFEILIDNRTGYNYVPVTKKQCIDWGGLAVCDNCNKTFKSGVLVFVLYDCLCCICFEEWRSRASIYPEDLQMQKLCSEEWYRRHFDV